MIIQHTTAQFKNHAWLTNPYVDQAGIAQVAAPMLAACQEQAFAKVDKTLHGSKLLLNPHFMTQCSHDVTS